MGARAMNRLCCWLALGVWLMAEPALAQVDEGPPPPFIEIHGFASQGFVLTTGNDYLVLDSTRGSFQLSELGLNFSKQLTDKLRFGAQFYARNFGIAGNYVPQVDWFHLDYRWRDWLGLRAGRLKIPHGLYNEFNDIDAGRVPILLPQSIYPLQARSFLFAQTGTEVYGFARSPAAGALEYRLYGGTMFFDPSLVVPAGSAVQLQFSVPYIVGGRLIWETPLPGLRLGASVLKLRLDTVAFLPMLMVNIENRTLAWVSFAELAFRALTVTAEYGRGNSKQTSAESPPSNFDVTGEDWYVMASYVAAPWLQPGVYYSLKVPDVANRGGLANKQHDLTATLRFDINPHWLVKIEGHYMIGTAGLVNPLRITPLPENPERHWAVFLVKTTAYF
jgi:hypothetical protein